MPSRRPPHPRSFQPWAPPAREHRAAGPLGNPWAQLGPTERWPFPRVSHSGGRFRSYNGNSRPGSRASQKGRMHETRVCQGGRGGGGGLAHRHRGSSACCAPAARRPHCPTRLERTVGPGPARGNRPAGCGGWQWVPSAAPGRSLHLEGPSPLPVQHLNNLAVTVRGTPFRKKKGAMGFDPSGFLWPHHGPHL